MTFTRTGDQRFSGRLSVLRGHDKKFGAGAKVGGNRAVTVCNRNFHSQQPFHRRGLEQFFQHGSGALKRFGQLGVLNLSGVNGFG